MAQSPSIGRIVHFFDGMAMGPSDARPKPNAAIITDVINGSADARVNITRFTSSGEALAWPNVPFSETPKEGCWTWPPFVPPSK